MVAKKASPRKTPVADLRFEPADEDLELPTDDPEPQEPEAPPRPSVEKHRGWTLVREGEWEISIGPDGFIMLPRYLQPADVEDFCSAARRAAEIGLTVQADNKARENDPRPAGLPTDTAIVTEGPPPAGAVRRPFSTIGRRSPK